MNLSIANSAWPWLTAQAAEPSAPGILVQLAPVLVIFAIFYFLLIAPMRRQRRELQALVDNLKKGDRVITNGGIHGEVASVEEGVVLLRVADSVKLKVSKSAIAGLEPVPGKGNKS